MKLQIKNEEMQNIYHFIRQSVFDLKYIARDSENIIIAIPSWVLYFIKQYQMYEYRGLNVPENQLYENLFFGIKTQPHFANEIVVFYVDYYINTELLKPMVYKINVVEY